MMKAATTATTMSCAECDVRCQRFGTHRNGLQRFRCPSCKKTYTEDHKRLIADMNLADEKARLALKLLIEGNSLRSTERITGVDINTLMKLLVRAGEKCDKLMGKLIVNIPAKDVQCDEIWAFVSKKEAHKTPMESEDESLGDAYCFVAMERNTKLVLNFALGRRSQATTDVFIEGLRAATSSQRFQISTDGFQPYLSAIKTTLSDRCDFAQLVKVYAADPLADHKYSPADVTHAEKVPVMGNPAPNGSARRTLNDRTSQSACPCAASRG
jgi:transposase-like protein/IS1 family transposase